MRKYLARIIVVSTAAFAGWVLSDDANPSSMDPAVVAPDEFTVELDNERIRALRVTINNGSAPGPHSHPERVVVFLTPCTWLEQTEDGSVLEETNVAGQILWMEPVIHEGGPTYVKDRCELLEIELK